MTKMNLPELRDIAESATKGEWYKDRDFPEVKISNSRILAVCSSPDSRSNQSNAAYISALNPQTAIELLDTIDRLERKERIMKDALHYVLRCSAYDNVNGELVAMDLRAIREPLSQVAAIDQEVNK